MKRIRSTRCTSHIAGWLYGLLALGLAISGGLSGTARAAQDLNFQSPPLAPIFPPSPSSAPPIGQGFGKEPGVIQDPQVRTTDFQLTAPAGSPGMALTPALPSTASLPATSVSTTAPGLPVAPPLGDANPPLANAIREFIEPDAGKPEERTSASLFQLSALKFDQLDWQKMVLSLAVVIGGYLGLMMLLRLWNPQGSSALPREVVEVLGTTPLNSRQSLQLVRLGSKLLLLIHSPEGTQSLGEISNPHEVEHLAQICCQRRGRKAPTAFRKFSESPSREPQSAPPLDALLKNLQLALQRSPGRTEYEA